MKKALVLSLALFSLSSVSLAASLTSMNHTQAKDALADKTITTIPAATLNGKMIDNTFTGYFSKDGTMQGKFTNKPDDGPQTDKGTWNVQANGAFCYTWENWDGGKEKCVTFYRLNNALLVIAENNKFETLILDTNIQSGNHLS